MNRMGNEHRPFLFMLSYDMEDNYIIPYESLAATEILFEMPGKSFGPVQQAPKVGDFFFSPQPVGFDDYRIAFDKVKAELMEGNSYLLNLTFPTPVQTNLSLEQIYYGAQAPYKLLLPGRFVCFSPEPFVLINGRKISTYPMKGTIDANVPDARQRLLDDPKETAEHRTIVDLLRNDLGIVARSVVVQRYRYIDEVETHRGRLLQMSSEISAEVDDDVWENLGSLFFKLLPAGSVTGAPKKKTIEIIKDAEGYRRGFYTGVFGWFDGEWLESSVMIRFIEQDENGAMVFKSGGGITVNSCAEKEYQELIDKVYVPFSGIR